MMTTADKFISLFRGRGDCYGSDLGGCVRKPLDRSVFMEHLNGITGIGVYPAVPASVPFCVWGCSDIDIESLQDAKLMKRTIELAGLQAHIERSRSKGYHVWVFVNKPVPAESMRRALLLAHQVANYPAREVNPKQSDVSTQKVGNYVRLPYLGGLKDVPTRRVMLDEHDEPIPLDWFVDYAYETRATPEDIETIASMYVPPVVNHVVLDLGTNESLDDALRATSPLARVIWQKGPLQGQDRSTALMRLAHVCRTSNITPSMCHAIVVDADMRWGKYHLRGQAGIDEINKIVQRAYSK